MVNLDFYRLFIVIFLPLNYLIVITKCYSIVKVVRKTTNIII